jgi:putative ABC transport system permease protein
MKIFKQQIRQLWNQKFSTSVNIIGMSIGFVCCIIIGLYIKNEVGYDNFHEKKDRIFRLLSYDQGTGQYSANVTYRLGPDCAEFINGVEKSARLYSLWGPYSVSYNNKVFNANDLFYTDAAIVDIFSFNFIAGDNSTALNAPGTVIITKSAAEKYFGEENPLGKTIIIDNSYNLVVTGVVHDYPENSHFHFNFLVYDPTRLEEFGDWVKQTWYFNNIYTYVLLSENFPLKKFKSEFQDFCNKNVDEQGREFVSKTGFQNLTDIHLYSKEITEDFSSKGSISGVIVFLSIAICILLIAFINYFSLSISVVTKRVKDVGIRIISGAKKSDIISLYIAESIIICIISLFLAILIVGIIHPLLINYVNLYFNINDLNSASFLFISFGSVLTISILSGILIANSILNHRALGMVKGNITSNRKGFTKSYIYLTVQFTASIILIICTGFIYKQMIFIQHSDLGYNSDLILTVPVSKTPETSKPLMLRLLKNPQIKAATLSSSFPPNQYHYSDITSLDDSVKKSITAKNFFADFNFIDFLKIKVIEGRDLSPDFNTDKDNGALVNKAFVDRMEWKSPLGKKFKDDWNGRDLTVVGVVENFHFKSFHEKIEPAVISISLNGNLYSMGIKLSGNDLQSSLNFIKSEWESINPLYPFEYSFLDEVLSQTYKNDKNQARIILIFSILAIIVTCLGLIAISVFLTKQRTKEIGLRKINGATVPEVMILLNVDFIKYVIIAMIIAIPVSYFIIQKWIENFAYKTELSWWMFALAGLLALCSVFLTVSWQSWKAVTRNPVEALRYE